MLGDDLNADLNVDLNTEYVKEFSETLGRKYDSDKVRYTLLPPFALKEVARNLTAGLEKYSENNWKHVEGARVRYLDAIYRHLEAHRAGEKFDKDSHVDNIWHLSAVIANALFLLEFELDDNLKDKGF